MGYNTVFMGLNDLAHEYRQSPNAFAELLSNAYGLCSSHGHEYSQMVYSTADSHGEPRPHGQVLKAVACFHSSEHQFFLAGGNTMNRLNVVRYGTTKEGKKTVTLELPEWWK